MPNNDFVPFATAANANVQPLDAYQTDGTTAVGNIAGIASSSKNNRALRQGTFIAAAIAQWAGNLSGLDSNDNGDLNTFVSHFNIAVNNAISATGGGLFLPLTGGTLSNPGNLHIMGSLTVDGPLNFPGTLTLGNLYVTGYTDTGTLNVRGNGITYARAQGHVFAFGWDGSHLHSYVDGNDLGSVQIGTTGAFLPLTGGTLYSAGAGDILTMIVDNGNYARMHTVVNGTRDWCFGTNADGTFHIDDISGSAGKVTVYPGGSGAIWLSGPTTIYSTLNTSGDITGPNMYCEEVFCNRIQQRAWNGDGLVIYGGLVVNPWIGGGNSCTFNGSVQIYGTQTGQKALDVTGPPVYLNTDVHISGTIYGGGVSDPRVKKNIEPYRRGLADVLKLEPISFNWNGEFGSPKEGVSSDPRAMDSLVKRRQFGVDASKVKEIMPEIVGVMHDDLLTLDSNSILYAVVNSIKELTKRLETLEGR